MSRMRPVAIDPTRTPALLGPNGIQAVHEAVSLKFFDA
jgi:hypothetical protein